MKIKSPICQVFEPILNTYHFDKLKVIQMGKKGINLFTQCFLNSVKLSKK
jgi:hypothetical protein